MEVKTVTNYDRFTNITTESNQLYNLEPFVYKIPYHTIRNIQNIIALLGNTLTILLVLKYKKLRTPSFTAIEFSYFR